MDSIAYIESNTTGTGEIFLETSQKKGLQVFFLTSNPEKYPFLKRLLIHPSVIDTNNVDAVFQFLSKIKNLVGVISTSESYVYNAALVAQKLNLPHTNPKVIAACRDKYKLSRLLKESNLPTISTSNKIKNDIHFPVVVKPNPGTGSIGVKLCHSLSEVKQQLEKIGPHFLIQEYIAGKEFSAEIVIENGTLHVLGITKKYLGPEPYFVENGHDFPANLPKELYNKVTHTLKTILEKLQYDFGPAHIEFRIRDQQVYIIEVNPRLAGGMIPILVEESTGIKLIENLIHLFIGQQCHWKPKTNFSTKIAFIIPEEEGVLKRATDPQQICNHDYIFNAYFYKAAGDIITLKGDFSDRAGYIIAKANSQKRCAEAIKKAKRHIQLSIVPFAFSHGRERLNQLLDPRVTQILEQDLFPDLDELKWLSQINKAHVRMLKTCHIISIEQAKKLIQGILELETENFSSVHDINEHGIGFYLAYEQCLIEKIGIETAGLIHIGRSRNDINATLQRLKSLEVYKKLYRSLWELRSDLLLVSQNHLETPMPIYSQYQPAMPATYAYYLIAVEETLSNIQTNLQSYLHSLTESPLGAVAGAGTTFPINPKITAELLGFKSTFTNALTAIANRNVELNLLASASILGTIISRIAQDYHMWLTSEFSFFELPDRLCGISSAMPQKKNPYLLEKIKGKAVGITGSFVSALATMQKVPFANSVEVGTEALTNYISSFSELIKSIKLLSLIVQGAKPIQKNLDKSNENGLTIATEISETLTRSKNISYRQAHQTVATTIQKSIENQKNPLPNLLSLINEDQLDVRDWHKKLEYGGGSGIQSTQQMLEHAIQKLYADQVFFLTKVDSLRPIREIR